MKLEADTLSALMDDALSDTEQPLAIQQLLDGAGAQSRWGRYHLIGAALRGQTDDAQLTLRIQAALASLEPLAKPPVLASRLARGRGDSKRLYNSSAWPSWHWVGAGGLAMAAAVLTVLLVLRPDSASQQPQTWAAIADGYTQVQPLPPASQTASQAARNAQLDRYLVSHYAANPSAPGVLPFVSLVGYDGRNPR